jgi:50S ribosomal protein L16 3-hydroxylase
MRQLAKKLKDLKLDRVETFLPGVAAYLSEPKPQAYFDGMVSQLSPEEFKRQLAKNDLRPHPQTRLLALGSVVYCNGEDVTSNQPAPVQAAWRALAASRQFKGSIAKNGAKNSLFEGFEAGWLVF